MIFGYQLLLRTRLCPIIARAKLFRGLVYKIRRAGDIVTRPFTSDDLVMEEIWLKHVYGPDDFLAYEDGETLVDIGSHIGIFARYYVSLCPSSRIVCCEPVPDNFRILRENLSGTRRDRIELLQVAVSGHEGEGVIHIDPANTGGHSLVSGDGPAIAVRTTTIGKILSQESIKGRIFLKIDCEGSEYEILESMAPGQLQRITKMAIEYHLPPLGPPDGDRVLARLLEASGFAVRYGSRYLTTGILLARR